MLVVHAFCRKDFSRSVDLFQWARELDGGPVTHDCLLVAAAECTPDELNLVRKEAARYFRSVQMVRQREPDNRGWPQAPNSMFRIAVTYLNNHPSSHWLWLENDCVPLHPGWLDALDGAYRSSGKPFMGAVWDTPFRHMTGCGIYPHNLLQYNPVIIADQPVPFDCIRPDLTLRHCQRTDLICHEWGDVLSNVAPTFPEQESLARIPSAAVLYHRCKDGSLIQRLRARSSIAPSEPDYLRAKEQVKLVVVGLIKNRNPHISKLLRSLGVLLDYGPQWTGFFIAADMESPDVKALKTWGEVQQRPVFIFPDPAGLPQERLRKMATLRNHLLSQVRQHGYTPDYLLAVDMDIAGFANVNRFEDLLSDNTWTAAAFFGIRPRKEIPHLPESTVFNYYGKPYCYYDLLAFESINGERVLWKESLHTDRWYQHGDVPATVKFVTAFPFNPQPVADTGAHVEVNSAFGPACVYRWPAIKELAYDATGEIEHGTLHRKIRAAGGKIIIAGDLVALYSDPENNVEVSMTVARKIARAVTMPNVVPAVKRTARALLTFGTSYYHSGNLGDIIYALYAIRQNGGGALTIGPKQRNTIVCPIPTTKPQFDMMLPLLKAQPYLQSVDFSADYPNGKIAYDLNKFRNHWTNWEFRCASNIHSLCRMHFYTLGILHRFHDNDPWLELGGSPVWTGRIIVHRSARYQAHDFPWAELARRHAGDMLFVGHENEHLQFEADFKCRVAFWKVKDFQEMAQVIAGGKCFVGNQSLPCALSLGIGQRTMVELWPSSPDVQFNRDNFLSQKDGLEKLEQWL